jgi:hypothetical protein
VYFARARSCPGLQTCRRDQEDGINHLRVVLLRSFVVCDGGIVFPLMFVRHLSSFFLPRAQKPSSGWDLELVACNVTSTTSVGGLKLLECVVSRYSPHHLF